MLILIIYRRKTVVQSSGERTCLALMLPWIWILEAVISLQMVMLSPETHLVKNHESQFKKQRVLSWKCLVLYVTRQLIWQDKLQNSLYSLLKLKIYSIYCKAWQRLKEIWFFPQFWSTLSPTLSKTTFSNSNLDQEIVDKESLCTCATS